jgi:hypothetical protein
VGYAPSWSAGEPGAALSGGAGWEGGSVFLSVVVEGVVSAGHGEHCSGAQFAEHVVGLVELGEVAGVYHEVGAESQGVDLVNGVGERAGHVGVRGPGETPVAVAELVSVRPSTPEGESGRPLGPESIG